MRFCKIAVVAIGIVLIFGNRATLLATDADDQLIKKYGSYNLPDDDAKSAQAVLDQIVNKLKKPTDRRNFKIVFVNSGDAFLFVDGPESKDDASVVISQGMYPYFENIDELAGVISHEMSHTTTFDKLKKVQRRIQAGREEIVTADVGGLERMSEAGYDPRQLRAFYVKLTTKLRRSISSPLIAGLEDHPPDELRVTKMDLWLTQNEAKNRWPNPSKLPDTIVKVAQSKPTAEPEYKPAPERPKEKRATTIQVVTIPRLIEELKKMPSFQKTGAREKIIVLRELAVSDFKYHLAIALYSPQERKHSQRTLDDYFERAAMFSGGWGWLDGNDIIQLPSKHGVEFHEPKKDDFAILLNEMTDIALASNEARARETAVAAIAAIREHSPSLQDLTRAATDRLLPRPTFASVSEYRTYIASHDLSVEQKSESLLSLLPVAETPEDKVYIFRQLGTDTAKIKVIEYPEPQLDLFLEKLPAMYSACIEVGDRELILGKNWPELRSYSDSRWKQQKKIEAAKTKLLEIVIGDNRVSLAEKFILFRNLNKYESHDEIARNVFFKAVKSFDELLELEEKLRTDLKDEEVRLDASAFKAALAGHPEWTISMKAVVRFSQNDAFWHKASYGENSFEKKIAFVKKKIEDLEEYDPDAGQLMGSVRRARRMFNGPAYEYDLKSSEETQRVLLERLRSSGNYPRSDEAQHKILLMMAKRGPTFYTDGLAEALYLDPAFTCQKCLEETLQARAVWAFDTRKRIYDRLVALSPAPPAVNGDRSQFLEAEIARVHHFFPEESLARVQVLEELADAIHANYAESKQIEAAKYSADANLEGIAIRLFSVVFEKLREPMRDWGDRSAEEKQFAFIEFLQGKSPLPKELEVDVSYSVGENRLLNQFQSLPPEFKAVVLNPLLSPPHGLYMTDGYRDRLIEMAIDGAGKEYRADAKLFLEALLHALHKTSPHEETLALSFILAQAGDSKQKLGEKIRIFLESMGNTGTSLGQKARQRRIAPTEFLEFLDDLQDQSRKPTRLQRFEMIARVLKVEDPDKVLEVISDLGSASTKVVEEVRYQDGRIPAGETRALKILRDHLDRTNELEVEKLNVMVDYLIEHGGPQYRKLKNVIEVVQRGLLAQSDARADSKAYGVISKVYQSGEVDAHGFKWIVIAQDAKAGADKQHSHEYVATGKSLKNLTTSEQAKVFPAIYDKEENILFAEPKGKDQIIPFEIDRHRGNFKVDLTQNPPVIYVIDYPLQSEISVAQRSSLFRLAGLVGYWRSNPSPWVAKEIAILLSKNLAEKSFLVPKALKQQVAATLEASRTSEIAADDLLFDLLSVTEVHGIRIHPKVWDYVTAISNASYYSSFKPKIDGMDALLARVASEAKTVTTNYLTNLPIQKRCAIAVGQIGGKLARKFASSARSRNLKNESVE
jgi:hypothetical protein